MSKTIEIKKENALKAWTEGCEDVKKVMETLFGKEFFKGSNKWMEVWASFCAAHNLSASLPYSDPKNSDEESTNAYVMLTHIARIKNEGWKPDWNNSSEYKYYPWFDMRSGSGFSFNDYGADRSCSFLGSRLCYKSRSLAESVGKDFLPIYEKFLTK